MAQDTLDRRPLPPMLLDMLIQWNIPHSTDGMARENEFKSCWPNGWFMSPFDTFIKNQAEKDNRNEVKLNSENFTQSNNQSLHY